MHTAVERTGFVPAFFQRGPKPKSQHKVGSKYIH
jgi:hypothetical protein